MVSVLQLKPSLDTRLWEEGERNYVERVAETIKDRLKGFDVYFPSKRYLLDTAVEWLHGFMAPRIRKKPHELRQGANSSPHRRGMA